MEQKQWNDLRLLARAEECGRRDLPPRRLFAKGMVATGQFQPYMTLQDYTSADFLCDPYQITPAVVRISLAAADSGAGDTSRDVRSFAVKLYTREGNCDLLSLSLPVGLCSSGDDFFALMDCIRPQQEEGIDDYCGYLRYAVQHPQALSGLLHLYGAQGIPGGYEAIESWSAGTALWRNRSGQLFFVRHRWVPEKEPVYLSENEGEFLCGFDPDRCRRQLYSWLNEGRAAVYELRLQIIGEEEARGREQLLCDPAVAWHAEDGVQVRAGRLRLTEIPKDSLRINQLLCFSPDAVVCGMELAENSFLHQMALILRTLQRARLGGLGTAAEVNRHIRRQRPLVEPTLTAVWGADQAQPAEAVYRRQARAVWNDMAPAQQQAVSRSIAQRLLFGAKQLQEPLLQSFAAVDDSLAKQIEMELSF